MELNSQVTLICGEDKTFSLVFYDGDDPVDFDDDTAIEFTVRKTPDAAELFDLTLADSEIAVSTAVDGQLDITVADTDTVSLAPGKYYWTLKRTDADANKIEAGRGVLFLVAAMG